VKAGTARWLTPVGRFLLRLDPEADRVAVSGPYAELLLLLRDRTRTALVAEFPSLLDHLGAAVDPADSARLRQVGYGNDPQTAYLQPAAHGLIRWPPIAEGHPDRWSSTLMAAARGVLVVLAFLGIPALLIALVGQRRDWA